MNLSLFLRSFKIVFVFVIIASFISLALYTSTNSVENALTRLVANSALELTAEEEEERTIREVHEVALYVDYVATAQLNQKSKHFNFPLYLNLSPQNFFSSFKKPPRLV